MKLRVFRNSMRTNIVWCDWWRASLIAIALSAQALAPAAFGAAEDPPSYGELMLIEKKENPTPPWQLELSGMQEFSNPYLDVVGVSASAKKSIGAFVFAGIEFTKYSASDSEVNQSVSQQLATDTIAQTVFRPKSSVYGVASVVPVSGHLNWFSANSVPFEMEFTLGYGSVSYEKKSSEGALLWRIGPRAFVSKTIGLQFQFGQEIESIFGGDRITKSHARIGVVARF